MTKILVKISGEWQEWEVEELVVLEGAVRSGNYYELEMESQKIMMESKDISHSGGGK